MARLVRILLGFTCVWFLTGLSIQKDECTILLHGLARTSKSMEHIERALEREGYRVANVAYPSTTRAIEVLAELAIDRGLKQCKGSSKVNFVTHSMGGILVRQYLSHGDIDNLNRVVMLGPPNQGSEIVDLVGEVTQLDWVNNWVSMPAGRQLGTGKHSLPKKLGRVDFDLGVIAGNKTTNPLLSKFLPDPDDGKVSVESTRVEGMSDHIVLPVPHSLMMRSRRVMNQVLHYLNHGEFFR